MQLTWLSVAVSCCPGSVRRPMCTGRVDLLIDVRFFVRSCSRSLAVACSGKVVGYGRVDRSMYQFFGRFVLVVFSFIGETEGKRSSSYDGAGNAMW